MKILIIETKEVVGDPKLVELLKKRVMPIFDQGHNVMITTKESALEHFDAHIVLSKDDSLGFAEVTTMAASLAMKGKLFPEFIGIVTELSTDSKSANPHSISAFQFKQSLPFKWYTISPSFVITDKKEIIDWEKVFDIIVEHFAVGYTKEECEMHLKGWAEDYQLVFEDIKNEKPVKNLIMFLEKLSPDIERNGGAFISNKQWKDFYTKAKEAFQLCSK